MREEIARGAAKRVCDHFLGMVLDWTAWHDLPPEHRMEIGLGLKSIVTAEVLALLHSTPVAGGEGSDVAVSRTTPVEVGTRDSAWAWREPAVDGLLYALDLEVHQNSPYYPERAIRKELAKALILEILSIYRCSSDSVAGGMGWARLEALLTDPEVGSPLATTTGNSGLNNTPAQEGAPERAP